MDYQLYIFDLNGTLTNTPFVDHAPLALLPGRKEKIAKLQAAGKLCAIASNQGGVAFGFTTEDEATAEIAGIAQQLNIEHFEVAFGHPKPKYGYEEYKSAYHMGRRKPGPDMIISLMKRLNVTPKQTVMVGDREEDQGAAKAAGIIFVWTNIFFAEPGELVAQVYQLYQQVVELTNDQELELIFFPDGAGEVGCHYRVAFAKWEELSQAPETIQAAIEEHKKTLVPATATSDDFDPFLDADDLP